MHDIFSIIFFQDLFFQSPLQTITSVSLMKRKVELLSGPLL